MRIKNKIFILGVISFICVTTYILYRQEQLNSRMFSIEFDKARTPFINTKLESLDGYFLLDLGASFNCSVSKNDIAKLPKSSFLGEKKFINFANNHFYTEEYLYPHATFLGLKIEDLILTTQSEDTHLFEITSFCPKHSFTPSNFIKNENIVGALGHKLLKNLNFLIDLKKSFLRLYPQNYIPLFNFPFKYSFFKKQASFEYVPDLGFVCHITINGCPKRFLLDTGSSFSIIKKTSAFDIEPSLKLSDSKSIKLAKIKLGNYSYQHNLLHVSDSFNMSNLDGFLGMDFFYNKVLFFNTKTHTITIASDT